MNYFEIFEIPGSLSVAHDELAAKYAALQKKYHPDLSSNAAHGDLQEMREKSSEIDKGFKILNDPDEIMRYVLSLKGLLREEEMYELPTDFLMQMQELNEGLTSGDILNIEEAETKVFQLQKSLYHEVQHIIEGYSDDTTTVAQLLQVKDYYYKKKYLERILARLDGMRNIAG